MTDYKNERANFIKINRPNTAYVTFRTDKAMVRAPLNVKAMATSDSSVQVASASLS